MQKKHPTTIAYGKTVAQLWWSWAQNQFQHILEGQETQQWRWSSERLDSNAPTFCQSWGKKTMETSLCVLSILNIVGAAILCVFSLSQTFFGNMAVDSSNNFFTSSRVISTPHPHQHILTHVNTTFSTMDRPSVFGPTGRATVFRQTCLWSLLLICHCNAKPSDKINWSKSSEQTHIWIVHFWQSYKDYGFPVLLNRLEDYKKHLWDERSVVWEDRCVDHPCHYYFCRRMSQVLGFQEQTQTLLLE